MVLVQKGDFYQHFSLDNIGQENVFYDILQRKIALLGYKDKKFKKSKTLHSSQRVTHGFGKKKGDFSNFCFC